ncbi:efflux transporter outer membrane subunit [Acidicapsa ligni]|uniref:efflux transporter outer membrane subunit n=1 Tax=Acidicapsa ligni TaxID=542300 RepID=UPI00295B6E01|nr:efflux transporter outer membrane subunit [Acidicapsa ligni]
MRLRWTTGFAASLCVVLSACNVGPKYHVPPATAQAPAATYKESPENFAGSSWTVAQPKDALLHGKWWEIFNEPELNGLEEQLNINNQNIKVSFENFMAARAVIREARSQLFPTLSVGPSFTRSRSSANLGSNVVTSSGTGAASKSGTQSTIESLPFDLSWEPDLWGKVRNTVRADQYAAQLSAADLENERLTEQASLAEFYFELRGQDALQKVFTDTVEADKKSLELTQNAYDAGVGDQISVVEAQNTLQNAEASATNTGVARAQYEHAIAMLIGKPASDFSLEVRPLMPNAPAIPIGVPSQLLERRPDIAGAERTMASANALIDVAYAAYYPDVTLTASGGLESSTLKHLLDWPSRFWSLGPSASETIFDAGLRRATINQNIATYNSDVANYRQTVLVAFQQVEDSLSTVRILSQQVGQQQEAVKSAEKFVELETNRYKSGIDPYVDVVTAQTTLLTDQQTIATLHTQEMTAAVQLVEALGGGWDKSQLPTPAQVTQKPSKAETAIQR